jgi:predicted nuclease of predicted toxin-antitoxin system
MRVLLDENLPHRLRLWLPGHEVSTVAYLGWNGVKNGELLGRAEADGFEVFVTADRNLQYQQNFMGRRIAMVYLTAQYWGVIFDNLAGIAEAIARASAGSYEIVECGRTSAG